MAAKKKKPQVQSGQGYADQYKKTVNKAYSKMYADATSPRAENPSYYSGPKGMKKFQEAVKTPMGSMILSGYVRRATGDMGAARAASRAKKKRK